MTLFRSRLPHSAASYLVLILPYACILFPIAISWTEESKVLELKENLKKDAIWLSWWTVFKPVYGKLNPRKGIKRNLTLIYRHGWKGSPILQGCRSDFAVLVHFLDSHLHEQVFFLCWWCVTAQIRLHKPKEKLRCSILCHFYPVRCADVCFVPFLQIQ